MTEISIRLDDYGWHVSWERTDAGEDEIKGCAHGRVFDNFGEAMRAALDDVIKNKGGSVSVIRVTRGVAKAALRQIHGVVV